MAAWLLLTVCFLAGVATLPIAALFAAVLYRLL